MSVFVLDQKHQPLMPCTQKRARLLLKKGRAVVHRMMPFTIRLKDRTVKQSTFQPVSLKIDPGSRTTGLALVRVEQTDQGEVHQVVHLAELTHRGEQVKEHLRKRSGYRRRRRCVNLRYRKSRFLNRGRKPGWLPPSLRSRMRNVLTWGARYQRWTPLTCIEVERVKFDLQLMQNPEISGVLYQQGELAGWELRSYLLEKFGRSCVYCGATSVPFEIDHLVPKSRGGSDRATNLVLTCHACNNRKGNRTAAEFGFPNAQKQAKTPLRDASAVNATRSALCNALTSLGLPLKTWSAGRTRWNRARFGVEKTHAYDAACVGDMAGVVRGNCTTLSIKANGRGSYARTNVDASGFPRGTLLRQKRVRGFGTGDLVKAQVPARLKTAGTHVGRVAVRRSGSFRVGRIDGISIRYCSLLQRADGYSYGLKKGSGVFSPA